MSTLVKGQSSLYIVPETVEGTYVAETLASHAVEPLQDGLEFSFSREPIERKTLTDTIEAVEPRLGKKTLTGSIPIEFKAHQTPGSEPRGAILYESLLGGKHQITTQVTTGEGHTTTDIFIEDADIAKFKVNGIVKVLHAGNHSCRPVQSIVSTPGSAKITLAIPLMVAPPDNVVIEKVTTYFHDTDSKSFSATYYAGGAIQEKIWGLKSISAAIEGWTVNETPSVNFSVEGLDISKDVEAPTVTPDFTNDAQVPVIIHACAWLGQMEIDYTEFTLSIENTKADLNSACAESGKIGTRKTAFNVTSNINPYMADDNLDRWNDFKNNVNTSLFTYAFNPTDVDGEFKEVVAVWIPNYKITNMPEVDQDGVLLDSIEGQAFRKVGKDTIFLSFI